MEGSDETEWTSIQFPGSEFGLDGELEIRSTFDKVCINFDRVLQSFSGVVPGSKETSESSSTPVAVL